MSPYVILLWLNFILCSLQHSGVEGYGCRKYQYTLLALKFKWKGESPSGIQPECFCAIQFHLYFPSWETGLGNLSICGPARGLIVKVVRLTCNLNIYEIDSDVAFFQSSIIQLVERRNNTQ